MTLNIVVSKGLTMEQWVRRDQPSKEFHGRVFQLQRTVSANMGRSTYICRSRKKAIRVKCGEQKKKKKKVSADRWVRRWAG